MPTTIQFPEKIGIGGWNATTQDGSGPTEGDPMNPSPKGVFMLV